MVSRHTHFSGTRWIHLWLHLKDILKSSSENVKSNTNQYSLDDLTAYRDDMQRFFYHTSHNLKGPVTRLNGLIELLLMENAAGDNQQYLGKIDREVKQMKRMLAKLQTINEIAEYEAKYQTCQLGEVISRVLARHQKNISEKNIFVRINTEEDYSLSYPEFLLFWMLDNLVENAIVFSQSDSHIQSYLEINIDKQDNQLLISLEDNGDGIRQESEEHLFELFYRDSPRSEGAGLGLYIVRECIKKMGGEIRLESKPSAFTRFELVLPYLLSSNEADRHEQINTAYKV